LVQISSGDARLSKASALLHEGRAGEAGTLLAELIRSSPDLAAAHYLLGVAHRLRGDLAASTASLRVALKLTPGAQGAALELARMLNASGAHRECIEVTEPASRADRPAEGLLVERARAFQALGLQDKRLAERERIAWLYPTKPSVYHNLAAALGDAGYPERAEQSAREALARGGTAPETWLVLARALQSQQRLDEAEGAFRETLLRRPGYAPALRDWAQLVWMRTGELDRALAVLDTAGAAVPQHQLIALKARLFEAADQARLGYDTLIGGRRSDHAELELVSASLAIGFDAQRALSHALRAERLAPGAEPVQRQLIDAFLAADRPEAALARIEALLRLRPLDQRLIASRWISWRMLGDERAAQLYDYETMVVSQTIDAPPGWQDLDAYLSDLAEALRELHGFGTHPVDQSLRFGTQTGTNLLRIDHPVIRAFQAAIERPIREYLSLVGSGGDPLRSRNCGDYLIAGMWSVRLQSNGFHIGHVHPMGWISSACYIDLPDAIDAETHEGWIHFGKPGIPTMPPLEAQHRVLPQRGALVLFPSYMWHGTEAWAGGGTRLTIAFDLIPASGA
jgi:tetratricopeptide (TPR) repeat protein